MVGDRTSTRKIVIRKRNKNLEFIADTHRSYDALQYPLIFWKGQDGYCIHIKRRDPTTDCESLIRKMLVLDPVKRFTIEQIRRHRWMAGAGASAAAPSGIVTAEPPRSPARALDPNEQVLRLMHSLGIDPAKTKESLRSNSYDHHAAIYLLLLERLKHRAADSGAGGGAQARRRPSSVAEQAIARKGGVPQLQPGGTQVSGPGQHHDQPARRSSEHAHRLSRSPETHLSRAPPSPPRAPSDPSSSETQRLLSLANVNMTEQRLLQRNLESGDGHRSFLVGNFDLLGSARIPSGDDAGRLQSMRNIDMLDPGMRLLGKSNMESIASSHRILTSTLEQHQKIMKQSSEDCRRLLQHSTTVGPDPRYANSDGSRLLTSSSFDSKCTIDTAKLSNIETAGANSANPLQNSTSATSFASEPLKMLNTSTTFTMSSEAAKLMSTLQQSPLPLPNAENNKINNYDPNRLVSHAQQQDISRLQSSTPPFKDYMNHIQTYSYIQNTVLPPLPNTDTLSSLTTTNDLFNNTGVYRNDSKFQNRYINSQNYVPLGSNSTGKTVEFQQQYSSSTDEGCETDMDDLSSIPSVPHRIGSYASSSSSSGVVNFYNTKSLSQNLSCDSSQSNFSAFESLDYQLSDCSSDLTSSLPSCTSTDDKLSYENNSMINTSPMHPCVYVSTSNNKSPCSGFLSRHNPLSYQTGNKNCPRSGTRSPVDFREGRRASDGLVAQQVISQATEAQKNTVAFNSQRLNESCKAKGVLELHLVQKEAQKLKTQYQASVPAEEMTQRQIQHNQFSASYSPHFMESKSGLPKRISLPENFNYTNTSPPLPASPKISSQSHQSSELADQVLNTSNSSSLQNIKPPLQQQLMQHRLLQQKRQILQKQVAMGQVNNANGGVDNAAAASLHSLQMGLSRRQMLRQQSYKIAQQQQILPPLPVPLSESENEDLLAFQAIVEGPNRSPKTAINENQESPYQASMEISLMTKDKTGNNENWSNLPSSLQNACQISELAGKPGHVQAPHPGVSGGAVGLSLKEPGHAAGALWGNAPPWPNSNLFQTPQCFQSSWQGHSLPPSAGMLPLSESPILELTEQMESM